jgi:hypothetical protein
MTEDLKLKTIWRQWRNTIFIFSGIFLLALTLRLINLTILPIFGDEAIYIRWSQIMGAEPGLRFVPLTDGKQPLFMWVLMFIVRRFSDPLFISRLTSICYGMGTLVGIFALSYILFRHSGGEKSEPIESREDPLASLQDDRNNNARKIALISSLFWAISPYSVFYDRLALVDSMLAMFGVWTLVFSVLAVKYMRFDFAMICGFFLGGALLTKSPGLFFAVMLPIVWMVSKWPKRKDGVMAGKKELVHLIKLGLLTSVTLIIAFVIYNILRLGESFHMIAIRNKDYVYPLNRLWTEPFDPLISNINRAYEWIWILGPSIIVIFALISIIYLIRKYGSLDIKRIISSFDFIRVKKPKPEIALVFVWSLIPIFASPVYAKVFAPRYILISLPTIFIFSALVFIYSYKNKLITKVLYFGLAIFILQALFTDYLLVTQPDKANLPRIIRFGYLEEWTSGTGIKEASLLIRNEYKNNPQDKIIVGTEGYFGTLPDGLQIYLNDLPEITIIGVGLDLGEIPESLIESKEAGNITYLLINDSRFKADPAEVGLKLIKAYPKELREEGTKEYNLYGPYDTLYLFEL